MYGYNDGFMGLSWYEEELDRDYMEWYEQDDIKDVQNGLKDDDRQGT